MKTITKILLLVVLFAALFALPAPVMAQSNSGDSGKVVLGGTYQLSSGQTLNGDLAVIGGVATIEKNAVVNGDIALTGGIITINGTVNGDVFAVGGTINLGENAMVAGNVANISAILNKADKAVIKGEITSELPQSFNLPSFNWSNLPKPTVSFKPVTDILWAFFRSLAVAALAMLVGMLLSKPMENVANTLTAQPVVSGGLGVLTMIVAPALVVLMAVTLILIPIAVLGVLALGLAILFGWIALGYELGKRTAALFHTEWAVPISAGLGTLILSLVGSLVAIIPCVGWLLPALASMVGLGAVITSRFGARAAIPVIPMAPIPPTAPYPPEPPLPPTGPSIDGPVS